MSLARPCESDFPGAIGLSILGWPVTLDYLVGSVIRRVLISR